jgi:hypothetical protein
MGEGSPILSSGSFSDLIKAVLSDKSSIFLYKSGNNKAENDIHVDLPGHKNFLSFSETDTEKSEFCSIEVLDETADSKATVFLLN